MIHSPVRTQALQRFRPEPGRLYDLKWASRLAGVPRHSVLVYCRWGLVRPSTDPEIEGWYFSGEAISAIRRVEYLRWQQGVNVPGIRIIMQLLDEVERKLPPDW